MVPTNQPTNPAIKKEGLVFYHRKVILDADKTIEAYSISPDSTNEWQPYLMDADT